METITPKLILVPTDFSAPAAHALRYAAALGARFEAHLLVVYADLFGAPVDCIVGMAGTYDIARDAMVEAARERLQAFAEENIGREMPFDVRVVTGTPAESIVAQAEETGADLIVMGTHGRTGFRRLLLGSVTESVMHKARVPVIAVHEATPETASVEVVAGNRSTREGRAAVHYAGILADPENARFVDVADDEDIALAARRAGADLIALGMRGESHHDERVVQNSNCAVLTVNARTP